MADDLVNVRAFARTRVLELRWAPVGGGRGGGKGLQETLASRVEGRGTHELTRQV